MQTIPRTTKYKIVRYGGAVWLALMDQGWIMQAYVTTNSGDRWAAMLPRETQQ